MTINAINHLDKQKKKLALIFTLSIFIIILILESIFLFFKYTNYKNQQFQRLDNQLDMISRVPMINRPTQIPPHEPMLRFPDSIRRSRSENLIIVDKETSNVIFSSLEDNDIAKEIILKADSGNSHDILEYNWVDFFYLSRDLNKQTRVFIFTQSKITKADIFTELLEYILLLFLFSLILHYFWYKFISYNFSPVEENIKDMEQFIFNSWHELKTPLAVMKSSLQLAEAKDNIDDYKKSINDSITEIHKMNKLIESLINLSTIKMTEQSEKINANDSIAEILKNYSGLIQEKGIDLKVIQKNNFEINVNKEHFNIFFSNLINNAIKYNKDSWTIEIIVDKWIVIIKDSWIWIKKENIWKIFDRFYREEEFRSENSFWIWLSLVKKIADIYSWKIKIESEHWFWTEIKISF